MDVGVGVLQRTFMMMKLSLILWLLLQQTAITALQLPTTEVTRRTAVSNLIASTTAAAAASSSLISPPSALANELTASSNAITLNSQNKKAFPLASFGLQIYNDDVAYKLTLIALEVGYRNSLRASWQAIKRVLLRRLKTRVYHAMNYTFVELFSLTESMERTLHTKRQHRVALRICKHFQLVT